MVLARVVTRGIPTMDTGDPPSGAAFDFVADVATALVNSQVGISVINYGTVGDGATDDYTAINNALTAAVATSPDTILVFPPGTYLIETNITFTVPVLFIGGILRLDTGVVATFNQGYMNPSRQQCFDEQGRLPNAAGGVVVAADSPQDTVYPQDWGALADNSTDHQQIPIQQAIDAVTYTSSSVGKMGRVVFPSGTYKCSDSIFVGYDWETYTADYANREFACWRGHASSAQSRKQPVVLEGIGFARLRYTGADTSGQDNLTNNPAKYLLYTCSAVNARGHTFLKGLTVAGNFRIRGVYCSGWRYNGTIDGLTLYQTREVGLDWIECWGSRMLNVFGQQCQGHTVRTRNANSCYGETLKSQSYGQRNDYWPLPADQTVRESTGSAYVQSKVWERAAVDYTGNVSEWHNTIVEGSPLGTVMYVSVAADEKTCTENQHGLEVGDPIRWHDSDKETTVVSVTNVNVFVTTHAWGVEDGVAASKLIYRRATAITKANPGVVSCLNHGLAEGQWVKIMTGPGTSGGMTELNDIWYRVKYIDDDSFSLWSVWNGSNDTGTTALDTSGFVDAGDGTEYIVSSAAGVFLGGISGSVQLINARFEGNSILRTKIIMPHGSRASLVRGVTIEEADEGDCDYVIEMRDSQISCEVSGVQGGPITKALVLYDTPASTSNFMVGCRIKGNYVRSSFAVPSEEVVLWNRGNQYGNDIEGSVTPVPVSISPSDDTTPSVSQFKSDNDNYYRTPMNAMLSVPSGYTSAITDFDDGVDGQIINVRFLGSSATVSGLGNIVTLAAGTADLAPAAGDMLSFRFDDPNNDGSGTWYEI